MVTFTGREGIERVEFTSGEYLFDTAGKEFVMVLLAGELVANGYLFTREDVFSQAAHDFYAANDGYINVRVAKKAEVCLIESQSDNQVSFSAIEGLMSPTKHPGRGNYSRKVVTLVDSESGLRDIIVGETFKDSGNWSSWPPHKHDTHISEQESSQKEIYQYKFDKDDGFGIQIIYEGDIQNAKKHLVFNNDQVKIERGYHPVVASPHSKMYYLWVLFGENGFFKVKEDERFAS